MWPLPVVRRVGQSYRKIECVGYVRCSKNSLMPINGKVQRIRIAVPPRSHSLVEFDYHTLIEELKWSHKGFQGVALRSPEAQEGQQRPECYKSAHCVGLCHYGQNYL